ncbi:MAG: PAS domain S-box protein [Actinomycetota bacterium]
MVSSLRALGPPTGLSGHPEHLLRAIMESSEDAIIGKALDGTVVSWNAAAERIYGYSAAEMLGRSIFEIVPPELEGEVHDILALVACGERIENTETVRVHKDGRHIRVSLTVSPIRDDDGVVTGASVIARDVTGVARTREAMRLSDERYRVLFEQHPVPMWVYDPQTLGFLSVNEAAVSHYGYSRHEFKSLTIKDIRPDEDVDRLVTSISDGDGDGSWRHRRKDGSVFDVEILSRQITLDGSPAILVIATDVTERTKAERELRRAYEAEHAAVKQLRALDEMKNTFLNAVSHELRTPLSAVVGSATTLENLGVDLTSDNQRDLVHAIAANALKLQRLLGDLLDLDRLTRGALRPRLVATEIGDLVRRVVADSDFVHGRPVEVHVGQMVFPVDAPKVERILENLLANAMKYSPEGSPIWIRADRVPAGALIVVEDLGPGVPEEFRAQMFEPFRQGPNALSHAPGVGIGLSLVARFAELHKGRAYWEERPGGGSRFCVLLREPSAPMPGE